MLSLFNYLNILFRIMNNDFFKQCVSSHLAARLRGNLGTTKKGRDQLHPGLFLLILTVGLKPTPLFFPVFRHRFRRHRGRLIAPVVSDKGDHRGDLRVG